MSVLSLRSFTSLLAWAFLYFIFGYLSLLLDNPVSHVGFVWFPAGVSVAAFLYTPRERWLALFVLLFIAGALIDVPLQRDMLVAQLVSFISIVSDMAVAWLVRRYMRVGDDVRTTVLLFVFAILVSLLAALLGVGSLRLLSDLPFAGSVWIWWGTNVTGTLFCATILMAWLGPNVAQFHPTFGKVALGIAAWLLLGASAWHFFGDAMPPRGGTPVMFALACIPIVLVVIMAIACGNRVGSLALLTLGIIVIYHSADGRGPFFLRGFVSGEALLLAQCYLVATVLVLAFLRALTRSGHGGAGARQGPGGTFMYRLALNDGTLVWDGGIHNTLGLDAAALATLDSLLARVHPDERAGLSARLSMHAANGSTARPFSFRFAAQDGRWVSFLDRNPVALSDADGMVIVGQWHANGKPGLR